MPVIVHVGHTSAGEARALAAHAQKIGASAVSALAPCFFKPAGVEQLLDFCAQVAAGAPGLPFYFYHLPSLTGVTLSITELMPRAVERIPNFAGIKYTHNDLMEFQQCVRLAGDRLDVLFGRDEMLIAGLAVGGKGAVGSTYNYAAPVYHKLMKAFAAGDVRGAREAQAQAVRLVEVLRKFGEIPCAKAILGMVGVECGPARPPLANLNAAQVRAIGAELAGLDVFTRPLRPAV
jgi:N-acetylneuraminate lyase